jgi:hypothetical protein
MIRLSLLVLCLLTAGCALAPLTGPQTYQDGSMSFSVPAQWKVTMYGRGGGCGHAFVEAPGEAIVYIKGFPLTKDPGLPKYARDFSHTANSWTPLGKITSQGFQNMTDKRFGAGLKEPFTISFRSVEVPHTRIYRKQTGSHCVFYLLTQVADEDAASAEPGFRQILQSFSAK